MAEYDYDIAIIGGGAAGLTTASGAAQLGMRTLLIEREPKLGGDCLHYGCVPSKTLIHTASMRHKMLHAPDYGLPDMSVPPVRFSKVAARIRSVIDAIQHHDSPERFCNLGAEVRFGRASFLNSRTAEVDGKRVTSKYWVIASGSSPAVPNIPGLESAGYLTNREIFSLDRLPKSLIILGGGPVACEMAQAFQRLGSAVTVIQRNAQILSREDKDIADTAMTALSKDGVVFHLRSQIREVRPTGAGAEVRIVSGGQEKVIGGEKIFLAMGRAPNVEDMGLGNAGVEYGPSGVKVNERLRTSRSHILAAGDVLGKHMFTHAAGYEGGIIIANAVFKLPRKADYTLLPRCTYTEPEIAGMGMNEKEAEAAGIETNVYIERFRDNDRAWAERTTDGMVKLVLDKKEKPLGVQIAGPHAGELLAEWVAVLGGKVKPATLASAVHPYPTLAEINKRAASKIFSDKLFSDKVRKTLQFLFHYKGRACG